MGSGACKGEEHDRRVDRIANVSVGTAGHKIACRGVGSGVETTQTKGDARPYHEHRRGGLDGDDGKRSREQGAGVEKTELPGHHEEDTERREAFHPRSSLLCGPRHRHRRVVRRLLPEGVDRSTQGQAEDFRYQILPPVDGTRAFFLK
jgi:hypothetical protein